MKKLLKILAFCLPLVSFMSCKSVDRGASDLSQVPTPNPFNSWIGVSCDAYCDVKYDPRAQENTGIVRYMACIGNKQQCIQSTTAKTNQLQINESITNLNRNSQGFYVGNIYKTDTGARCIYLIGFKGNKDYVIKGYSMPGQECDEE